MYNKWHATLSETSFLAGQSETSSHSSWPIKENPSLQMTNQGRALTLDDQSETSSHSSWPIRDKLFLYLANQGDLALAGQFGRSFHSNWPIRKEFSQQLAIEGKSYKLLLQLVNQGEALILAGQSGRSLQLSLQLANQGQAYKSIVGQLLLLQFS